MSGLGFTRPDVCSISAATEQTEFAGAVSGLFSADGCPLGSDYPLGSLAPDVALTLVEAGLRVAPPRPVRFAIPAPRGQRTEAGR
jgi:hypothetical protein